MSIHIHILESSASASSPMCTHLFAYDCLTFITVCNHTQARQAAARTPEQRHAQAGALGVLVSVLLPVAQQKSDVTSENRILETVTTVHSLSCGSGFNSRGLLCWLHQRSCNQPHLDRSNTAAGVFIKKKS